MSWNGVTLTGSDTLKLKVTDAAGNDGAVYGQAYVLDTISPTVTVSSGSFSADTGTSNTDFITKTAGQTISGTLSANLSSGETVYVSLDNGGTWTAATATVGQNTWSLSGQTLTASNTLKVRVSDTAGNYGTAYSQAYVLDTTPPTTTVATKSFSADTGSSSTDFITKTSAQTISGTLSANVASGEVVYVSLDNGSTWAAATTSVGANAWSLSGQTLTGSNTLKVKVTDAAGNDGTVSSQAYVLDTTAPTTTVATQSFSADTGTSSTDFVTKTASQTVSGTVSANMVAGEIVEVSLDNGTTWTTATTTVGSNTWTLSGVTLLGSNTLKVRVSDSAGNSGTVYNQAYVLDQLAPTVSNVTSSTANGTYKVGDTISVQVNFTEAVTITGTPQLTLETGTTDRVISYAGGSGTSTLTFTYTVQAGDTTSDLDYISTSALTLNGGTIMDAAGNNATLTLATTGAANSLGDNKNIVIDGNAPTTTSVSVPSNSTYGASANLDFTINFSENVTVNTSGGNPRIALTIGSTTRYATYVSGSGTSALLFRYTTVTGDNDSDGIAVAGTMDANGGTLQDAAGNDATLTLNSVGSTAAVLVSTNQVPVLSTPTTATYSDTSAADSFSNTTGTLSATDNENDTITYGITGGTVSGGVSTKAGTYGSLSVNTTTGAYTYTPNASAIEGLTANTSETFTVTASDASSSGTATYTVNITGVNDLPTDISLTLTSVSQSGGANATVGTLSTTDADTGDTHTYSLVSGTGDSNNGLFNISGTSLRATNAASMSPGTYTVRVLTTDAASATYAKVMTITVADDVAPTVTSVSVPSNAWYAAGQNLDFTVNFSESVTVVTTGGTPCIALTVGTTTVYADYVSGSGTTALVFRYTVQTNDLDTNGIAVGTLALNSGSLADASGNNAVLTLNSVGSTSAVLVDAVTPSAPSTPDLALASDTGTSNTDNITSDTTPTLTGTAEAGSTVTLYDTDGTVLGTAVATVGNWSITSAALSAGAHTLTVKATDAAGNTSAASATLTINVDATAPSAVTLSTTSVADTAATNGSTVATLSATDNPGVTYALIAGANDTNNGSFTISGGNLQAAANLAAGTYNIRVQATDAAGNTTEQTFTITVTAGPSVTSINRAGATALTNANSVAFTVTFNESVTGVDTSDFVLTRTGSVQGSIASVTGSGSTYTVTVNGLSGDGTLRLDLNNTGTGIANTGLQAITGGFTSGQSYTLDTSSPTAPTGLDLVAGSDSGTSSTDNITSVTTPTITGGGAEAGATVTLYDTNGTTVLGTATADGSGNWSITSSTLSSGTHTLTTKVTDAAGNTGAASAGLTVTIDTTPPSAIALSANSVMDVATGTNTAVATLSASDTQAVSYALVAGNGTNDAGNGSFVIVGGTLQSRSQLTPGTYNIRVGATDAAGNVSYQTFTITVNTNTAPTITSGTTATVAENAPITTVVYTATATDVDPGQTLSYSLTGTDAVSFDINATTGAVTLKNSANYETKSSYSFNVVATDNGTPNRADTRAVTLTVSDVNDAPTGSLTINGTVKQGETLTVTDTLADEDGINGKTYQWYADGQPITGANLSTFTLGQDQVGKVITVKASYTDGVGRQEVVSSTATVSVANVNDPTTGEVSVGGQSGVGQTLTATNTLADLDGLGTVSYQWQYKDASGQWQNITQTNGQLATGASYTVEPQLALKELRVKASYTDGQGTQEVMYSTANVKAGGLPPTPVMPTPTVTTPAPVPQVVLVEPVKAPTSTFISIGTVNAVPVLAASPAVVIPVSVIPEQSAAQAAASVVSLGVSNPVGNATTGLRAVEATRDVVLERGEQASFTLPAGTFVHSDGAARVSLSARLADGRPLPNYVKFNPTTGTFTVEDTQGQATDLQVIVNAVDDKGSTASTTLVIKLKEKARNSSALDLPIKLGKLSLGEQIRLAEKPAGHLAELAALSKAFAANQTQRTHT